MADGNIVYAQRDGLVVLRLEGQIRHTLGHSLDTFLDRLFARGGFDNILVDLTATESIDSTGLGLLAKMANLQRRRGAGKALLVSPHADINEVLSSMCLDQVFMACAQPPETGPGQSLPATDPTASELGRTVLDAHRILCDLNECNRAMFQSVVDALEEDLGPP